VALTDLAAIIRVMDPIKKREMYAVDHGDYVGQMFVVIAVNKDNVSCLSMPGMENVEVPSDKFNLGRNSDIITLVEKLSKNIWKTCEAQYKKNTK
tara:strand:- start:389 stop:673 length:285 start_codon:yes stop_codon:yes gene_type:complete